MLKMIHLNILNNFKNENLKILMHCFTGSLKFLAKKFLKLNTFFQQVAL